MQSVNSHLIIEGRWLYYGLYMYYNDSVSIFEIFCNHKNIFFGINFILDTKRWFFRKKNKIIIVNIFTQCLLVLFLPDISPLVAW